MKSDQVFVSDKCHCVDFALETVLIAFIGEIAAWNNLASVGLAVSCVENFEDSREGTTAEHVSENVVSNGLWYLLPDRQIHWLRSVVTFSMGEFQLGFVCQGLSGGYISKLCR